MRNNNVFKINSIDERERCRKAIFSLDTNAGYEVFIANNEKSKTIRQCNYFYKLLSEFVKTANNSGLGGVCDKNIGWWKYQIKKRAEYYDTRKGVLFNEDEAKFINNELKKIDKDAREKIIKAMTMEMKSISKATTKELCILFNALVITIIDTLPQEVILTNDFICSTIVKVFNNLLDKDISDNPETEKLLFAMQKIDFNKFIQ